jgi:hypothetical protein
VFVFSEIIHFSTTKKMNEEVANKFKFTFKEEIEEKYF